MPDHYFSKNPEVKSSPKFWETTLRNETFRFKTDQGVFSKNVVDFGSRLLIETFKPPEVEGPFLDVGCGYGPIGISLAQQFSDRTLHMVDVNERAISLAEENATLNRVENVQIYESDRFANIGQSDFAAIITNPPIRAGKEIVHSILIESIAHLRSNGELWVVIQKKQGAPSAQAKLEEYFNKVEVVKRSKGYYIIKAIKY